MCSRWRSVPSASKCPDESPATLCSACSARQRGVEIRGGRHPLAGPGPSDGQRGRGDGPARGVLEREPAASPAASAPFRVSPAPTVSTASTARAGIGVEPRSVSSRAPAAPRLTRIAEGTPAVRRRAMAAATSVSERQSGQRGRARPRSASRCRRRRGSPRSSPVAGAGLRMVVAPAARAAVERLDHGARSGSRARPGRHRRARSDRPRRAPSRTRAGVTAALAPDATAMLFSPRASTRMSATPVASPAGSRGPRRRCPRPRAPLAPAVPNASSPTAPTKQVCAPSRAAATAWFPPLPP